MEKDSKTGLTKLLIDEMCEDSGISPRPATAAGAPERMGTPKKRRQVAVSVGEVGASPCVVSLRFHVWVDAWIRRCMCVEIRDCLRSVELFAVPDSLVGCRAELIHPASSL
jgi:hypothetical protein